MVSMIVSQWDLPAHWYVVVAALICFLVLKHQVILDALYSSVLQPILSSTLNWWLLRRHPIVSFDGTGRPVPTCPYRWPNGQGDVAKFLEGSENSSIWSRTYGRVYRIWSGTNQEIVISQSEDIKTVFRDSHKHAKALGNDAGFIMQQLLGDCLGLINHEPYRKLRSVLDPPFSAASSLGYLDAIGDEVRKTFEDAPPGSNLKRGRIDPVADLKLLPFWIVATILYGEVTGEFRRELQGMIPLREGLFMRMIRGGVSRFGWSKFLPSKINAELVEWQARWKAFNLRIAAANPSSLAAGLLRRVEAGEFSEAQVLQTVDEMLFANLDVTMGAISWNLVFLAQYGDVQRRVREEIRERTAGGDGGSLADYVRDEETLLHSTVLESARLRPLAAFCVPQSAPTERRVGGFSVPAHTNFVVDTHALNVRQPFWGASERERHEFRPERFLRCNRTEARYNYWRFGFGPRQCLGKFVADAIIKLLLLHLLDRYELGVPADAKQQDWLTNPSSWILHPDIVLDCRRLAQ